jgi:hypothetical protein
MHFSGPLDFHLEIGIIFKGQQGAHPNHQTGGDQAGR